MYLSSTRKATLASLWKHFMMNNIIGNFHLEKGTPELIFVFCCCLSWLRHPYFASCFCFFVEDLCYLYVSCIFRLWPPLAFFYQHQQTLINFLSSSSLMPHAAEEKVNADADSRTIWTFIVIQGKKGTCKAKHRWKGWSLGQNYEDVTHDMYKQEEKERAKPTWGKHWEGVGQMTTGQRTDTGNTGTRQMGKQAK